MRKRQIFWMMCCIISGILSCTPLDCTVTGDCETAVLPVERIDIHVDGQLDLDFHLEGHSEHELIDHLITGFPSYTYSFVLHLSEDRDLEITVTNEHLAESWLYPGIPYDVFPTSVLNNKYKYVQAELIGKTASAHFASQVGNVAPLDITLDVFHIAAVEGSWLRARVSNLPLYQIEDPSNSVIINGTFVSEIPDLLY